MKDVRTDGKRRIDRVLSEAFVADLPSLSMEDLREHRAEAEQEEVDLSYLRRLLQGRIDIVQAEIRGRAAGGTEHVIDHLKQVLADHPAPPFGLGRHVVVEPSRVDQYRRRVERLVADVALSDVGAQTDMQLQGSLATFTVEERQISALRRAVQGVMDRCGAEIARRYRDGEASVDTLLAEEQH
jgi:hypothetical protein